MLDKIPPFAKNFYFIVSLLFIVWMLFFDTNDFISQWQMKHKLSNLKNDKAYYEHLIVEVKHDRKELMGDSELLEKYAREKYLMKKPNEDLYVVIVED